MLRKFKTAVEESPQLIQQYAGTVIGILVAILTLCLGTFLIVAGRA